jgi:uncharacterized cofD-like protein
MKKNGKLKIVTIGGGTGGSVIDESLKENFPNITSIVTSFDNGGSTGVLRREFGMLPQGDIRRRIFAQRTVENKILEDIYNFRFSENNSLEDHSMGNLMILAATKIWGEKEGIKNICKLWGIEGSVLPVTYDYAELAAKLTNGTVLIGEDVVGQTRINKRDKKDERKIEKVYLTRKTKINPDVEKAILAADYIILAPGDFYTSLIPNFLVPGFCEAIRKAKIKNKNLKIIYVANIMTKAAETRNFKLSDFVLEAEKYLGQKLDIIMVNKTKINKLLLAKYKKYEDSVPVLNDLENRDRRVVEVNMIKQNGVVRHDKKLFLKAFQDVLLKKKSKIKFVFDLDDTLIPTFKYGQEYKSGEYKNLKFFNNSTTVLENIGKKNLILLTYDRYGNQLKKLKHLNVKKYFSEIYVVDEPIKKRYILEKLKKQYQDLVVVGDRYEEGELIHAENMGLETVCVAMPGGMHYNEEHHQKHLLLIKDEKDFSKILDL